DIMYRKYWYKSGTNTTMTNELMGIAKKAQELMHLEVGDIFLDIGCNDGTLLSFVEKHIVRIGFDPNDFKVESIKHASVIVNNYFTFKEYQKTIHGHKKAKIITSIAMFYDLEKPNAFVQDIKKTLDRNGLWIIQMSYLPLMLKQLAFDNICHEHLEYYSLGSLNYLLEKNGMQVVDCELNDVNGGSFRIYIRHKNSDPGTFATAPHRDVSSMRVASILEYEKTLKLYDKKIYLDFWKGINKLKNETVSFIKNEKKKGKKIWGYGASTKGNTLLQWFGLDHTLIDAIAERSPAKFGLKTAGTDIPIYSEEEMRKAKPDYLLVLPWHFISEFKKRETNFLKIGGKLIVPCPRFEVIGE
ncbi:MAG: class I SAM-dependent methyltransferase, partial [bacterium]|nr:class I SAM-dependent methyltransferase [bacterium]